MPMVKLDREGSEYATYGSFTVEYRDASHRYWLIDNVTGAREPATSVTSALQVIDKPGLRDWYERISARDAVRATREGEMTDIDPDRDEDGRETQKRLQELGLGAMKARDAGADRGSAVHEALLAYCTLGTIPDLEDFEDGQRGYVEGLCAWLAVARPTPIVTECIVGSALHGFAGRFDLLAEINGETVLCDLKTSKRVGVEYHLQLEGYKLALAECRSEVPDRTAVVTVAEDGSYKETRGEGSIAGFLAALRLNWAVGDLEKIVRAQWKAEREAEGE